MRRPSERPLPGVRELTDKEAPDFIEAHHVAVLAFADLTTETSIRLRGRLNLLAARHATPGAPKRLGVGVVDVSEHAHVAEALGVKSAPALVVFVEGTVEDRLMGVPPEAVLDEVISTRLARLD